MEQVDKRHTTSTSFGSLAVLSRGWAPTSDRYLYLPLVYFGHWKICVRYHLPLETEIWIGFPKDKDSI